jgi:HEAT repeat protein
VAVQSSYGTTDLDHKAEFREAIASMVPSLIKQLQDEDKDVRSKTVELIGELANHGER